MCLYNGKESPFKRKIREDGQALARYYPKYVIRGYTADEPKFERMYLHKRLDRYRPALLERVFKFLEFCGVEDPFLFAIEVDRAGISLRRFTRLSRKEVRLAS